MNILITGAAQGIGAAIAKELATLENKLILVDLQEDLLNSTATKIRPFCKDVVTFASDITSPEFISELRNYVNKHQLDVLINNAGVVHQLKPFEELSTSDFDLAYKVNIKAPFELIQLALSSMKINHSGIILNVASRANVYGYSHMGIYAATKAAITSFTGTVALEDPEIKAVTIIPGRTNTPMQKSIRGEEEASQAQSPDYVAGIIAEIINNKIECTSGDSVIVDFETYKVVSELDKEDLHKNMH